MSDIQTPGDRVKYVLDKHGVTVAEAATALEMNRTHLHAIIRGDPPPRKAFALALQALYGIDADWIMTGKDYQGDDLREPAPTYTQKDITPAARDLLQEKEELIQDCLDKIDALKKSIRLLAADDTDRAKKEQELDDEARDLLDGTDTTVPEIS